MKKTVLSKSIEFSVVNLCPLAEEIEYASVRWRREKNMPLSEQVIYLARHSETRFIVDELLVVTHISMKHFTIHHFRPS